MKSNIDVLTREATRKDLPFLFDSYWRSYVAYAGRPRESALMRLRDRFSGLWLRAKFILAVNPESPEHILGWVCYEGPVIHYAYVKAAYRNQGLAQMLCDIAESARMPGAAERGPLYATHWTPTAQLIASTHQNITCICLDSPIAIEVFNDESVEAAV